MPLVSLPTDPDDLDALIASVAGRLTDGEVVVLPTDTVYGVVVRAADPKALDALRAAKGRAADVPIAVLVAGAEQVASLCGGLHGVASRLADQWWPGPLTLVVAASPDAPSVGGSSTIGIRCPSDELIRALAAAVGPLAASSANLHGEPTPTLAAEVHQFFPDLLVVDGGARTGAPSTVVDATADPPRVLRAGAIPAASIEAVIEEGRG